MFKVQRECQPVFFIFIAETMTKKYFPYLFLAACAIIAFAPVAFMQHCMKFDMTDQYLPWRYFVGECLKNGHLPLWNPYTHFGYPIHADPQSGAWYPVVWLIGALFGYNMFWIHIEFLLHVFLAGVGMFLLADYFTNEKRISLATAICYMLCGFFSGNAQHLTWIISGTWIAFVLFYFLRFQQQGNNKDLFHTALAFFMLMTGGYPAFLITTAYSLAVMAAVHLWRIKKVKQTFLIFIRRYALLFLLLIITNSVSITSAITNSSASVRSKPLAIDFALSNPFGPKALLSFLFPLASVKNPELFNSDISMTNGFIGMIGLAGLILFIIRCRAKKEILLFAVGVFFLLIAFGKSTPLRGWLYYVLPLFDRFRMASLFRLFALILFVICAATGWKKFLIDQPNKKIITATLLFILLFLITGITYSSFHLSDNSILPQFSRWNEYIKNLSFNESIFMQGIGQSVFLIIVIILLNVSKNFISMLPWLTGINLCIATLVNNPVTVVNDEEPIALDKKINQLPEDFPIRMLQPMEKFRDRENTIGQFWLNLGIWNKQPYWQGYNSYQSPQYNKFEICPQAKYVLKNPLIYFSSATSLYKDTITDTLAIYNDHTHLYLQDELNIPMIALKRDTAAQLNITSFGPNQIKVKTHSLQMQWLTLLQQHVNGWKVFVDGNETETYTSNYLFVSSLIPEGNHEVIFDYQNKMVVFFFWVSVVAVVLVIALAMLN